MAEVKIDLSPFKGLDWYAYPGMMQDGYSPDCENVEFEAGILRSIKGYNSISYRGGCKYFYNHYKNDGTVIPLVFVSGNIENLKTEQVYKSDYYLDFDTLSMVNYQLNDTYITVICNGRTAPVKFDGTSVTNLGGNPPAAAFVELHNERLFMAGTSSNPDRIYYSASFDPESWSVEIESGYIDLPSWDGGRIRDIKSMFGDLVVFKDFGLYRIYGTYPGEFGVEKINSNVGCINRKTITFNGTTCHFVNSQGLCVYDGMSAGLVNDKRIKALFDRVNFDRIQYVCMFDYGGKLYMFLTMTQDCMIEYDYTTGVIVRKKGIRAHQFYADNDGLYFIDINTRVCMYNLSDTFDGYAINSYWKSRTFDLGSKGEYKNIHSMCFMAKGNGSITLSVHTEMGSYSSTFVLTSDYAYYSVPVRARGRQFTVEISSSGTFEIDSPSLFIDIEEE